MFWVQSKWQLHIIWDGLDKLTSKDGTLLPSAIQSIVDSVQFMSDYKNHSSLSYDGRMHTDAFKREMIDVIHREPEILTSPKKAWKAIYQRLNTNILSNTNYN